MPSERARHETEELLKEGCRRIIREKRNGIKINVKQTACDLNIPYSTLRACFLNIHKHSLSNIHSPPQPISTNLAHTSIL
ncbi:hypothetical protein L208DRAFT_1413145 [Tricholoma matsutake]|nr:hypothetical protein L208DRAFT_1413145 [Tricholoma matsutake 945]